VVTQAALETLRERRPAAARCRYGARASRRADRSRSPFAAAIASAASTMRWSTSAAAGSPVSIMPWSSEEGALYCSVSFALPSLKASWGVVADLKEVRRDRRK